MNWLAIGDMLHLCPYTFVHFTFQRVYMKSRSDWGCGVLYISICVCHWRVWRETPINHWCVNNVNGSSQKKTCIIMDYVYIFCHISTYNLSKDHHLRRIGIQQNLTIGHIFVHFSRNVLFGLCRNISMYPRT